MTTKKKTLLEHTQEYLAFLKKQLDSENYKKNVSKEEYQKTKDKYDKEKFKLKTLLAKAGKK